MHILIIYNSYDLGLKITTVDMTESEYERFSIINNKAMNADELTTAEYTALSVLDAALTLTEDSAIDYGFEESSEEEKYFGKWATDWDLDLDANIADGVDNTIRFSWY